MDNLTERHSPGEVEELRRRYCEGSEVVSAIRASVGISGRRFYALARREGWPMRQTALRGRRAAGRTASGPTAGEEPIRPAERRAMATRLERFVAGRIATLGSEPADDAAGAERQARTLNQLARTAAAIRVYLDSLREDDVERDVDEPPPRSLTELRDELRRHLERIREEERHRELRREPDPD